VATYAVGDIQGCLDALRGLLRQCHFDARQDRLWLVGDIVNRGPQSLETLRFVRDLGESAVMVLGNHDLYLLMAASGSARKHSRSDSIEDILQATDRDELLTWLRHRPLCHAEPNPQDGGTYCLVHAGLLPQWSVPQAARLAREVEQALRGEHYPEFMGHMWGSEPNAWNKSLKGWPRLRLIVNAMTRLRFCTPDGQMEFATKGLPKDAPPGYVPWYQTTNRKSADDTLVTGHWSALGLVNTPRLLALDTGYLWGGALSAVRLEDRKLFQVCA